MNKGLKNKGLGSWFCLAAALVALITGIVFLLTQATAAPLGHSGTMAGVVLLVGAAASLVFFFVSVPFSALIQAVIYNIALYLVVVQLYFVFADVINHVTFAGGNAGLCVFYIALDLEKEGEQHKEQHALCNHGALIRNVDPLGSCGGLVGVKSNLLAFLIYKAADLLGRCVLGNHKSQIEQRLPDTLGEHLGKADQCGGKALDADAL